MKTIVGLFDDFAQAKSAAVELERMGVSHNDISVLANNETEVHGPNNAPVDKGMGHAITKDAGVGAEIGGVLGLLAGLSLFVIPGLGFIAGAGWLAGMLTGAGIGAVAGGLVGALVHVGVPATDAAYYNEGVRRGGTLVAVKADESIVSRVAQTLNSRGAINIEERAAQYRNDGFVVQPEGSIPGIQTGGHAIDGSGAPDTRGITEKIADTVTGDRIDDKTGKPV